MATSKGGREKIKLESTAGTGHFYTTSKNKKTTMPSDVKKRADRLWRLGNACSLLAKRQYTRSSVGLLGIRGLA